MANALAEQIRVARQQGLSPTQAFHELMRSPDFVEAFIRDPDFGKTVIQAAQLAKADPAEAFGQATQAGEQQGFLSRDLRQRLDLLASTDLKTAVEQGSGQELVPEPETLAQVATREQQASAEDRRQSLAERKFLFETKKWEYEQKAAGNPAFKDIDKIADAFRQEAQPYTNSIRGYEKVRELRGKRGSAVSDTAAGTIVLAFLQSLKPSVSASAALGEAENLAVTGSISPAHPRHRAALGFRRPYQPGRTGRYPRRQPRFGHGRERHLQRHRASLHEHWRQQLPPHLSGRHPKARHSAACPARDAGRAASRPRGEAPPGRAGSA